MAGIGILFAWELGANLGHVGAIAPLAEELSCRGNKVFVAARNLYSAHSLISDSSIHLLQAPGNTRPYAGTALVRSLPEILLRNGYASVDSLMPLVKAWLTLIDQIKPDLVVSDYSPSAQLAAKIRALPVMIIGNSFYSPLPGWPPVNYRYWQRDQGTDAIHSAEMQVVDRVNEVCGAYGAEPINHSSDLYKAERYCFFNPPQLDGQADLRQKVRYLPPPESSQAHWKPVWPSGSGNNKKIYAYLRYGALNSETALSVLANSDQKVICFYAEAPDQVCRAYSSAKVRVTNQPFDLTTTLLQVDMVVGHGGINTTSAALYAGRPLLLVPTQLEQIYNARCIEECGAGLWLHKNDDLLTCQEKLSQVLWNEKFYSEVQSAFRQYRQTTPSETVDIVCRDFLEALLKEH